MKKDLLEAIDSLERKLEMLEEDEGLKELYGIPYRVEDSMRACHTLEQVKERIASMPDLKMVFISSSLENELQENWIGEPR